jgi:polyribonucleotide nucleotidyltransferase
MEVKVQADLSGKILSIETGKVAKQAHGAAMVRLGGYYDSGYRGRGKTDG